MSWLPDNFTRLTYLGGTGSQYIDTNVHLDNENIVKSTWTFYDDAACIYGCFTSSADTDNFCLYGGSHANDAYIRFGGQLVRKFRPNSGSTYSFEHGADGFFVDGERITEFSPATFTCSATLRIFGLPNSKYAPISGRCYNFQVLKKTESSKKPELLHDFVPVRRNDDDVLGLYDIVENVFYTNNGSGTFKAGEDVIETPTNILSSFRRRMMAAAAMTQEKIVKVPAKFIYIPIANTYIDNNTGEEIPYNNWSSTPYIPIEGYSIIVALSNGRAGTIAYHHFYGTSKNALGQGTWNGYAYVPPRGAKYVRFSNTSSEQITVIGTSDDDVLTPTVEVPDAYINNGTDTPYTGWNIYRVDNDDYVGIASTNQATAAWNAFYDTNGYMSMFSTYAQIPSGCTYIRFSNDAATCRVFPVKEEVLIDPDDPTTLPTGYTRYDWLEANNAYIDTLYNFPSGYTFRARIKLVTPGSTYKLLFGSEAATGNVVNRQLIGWGPSYKNLYIGCGNFAQIATSFEYGRYYDYEGVIKNGNSHITLDGKTAATYSGQFTLSSFNNCYLFCDNVRGTANYFANVRVSGTIKIYDSAGTLIRHLVPCTDPNDVPGYYDAITNGFFPKSGGSGTISVGLD